MQRSRPPSLNREGACALGVSFEVKYSQYTVSGILPAKGTQGLPGLVFAEGVPAPT